LQEIGFNYIGFSPGFYISDTTPFSPANTIHARLSFPGSWKETVMTRVRAALTMLAVAVLGVFAEGGTASAAPPAPGVIAPATGAAVTVPFTASWSAVTDPSGIVAYNWQVSASSLFATVILQNSTSGQLQDTVSGLANGVYFIRVQAVNGSFTQGAWSPAHQFTVTGPALGSLGPPTLQPTKAYSTFHPFELIVFNWSPVPGAVTYKLQFSIDPSFPVVTRGQFDNIPNTTMSFEIANPEGNYSARVFAIDSSGVASQPSNAITFAVFFNNPIGPPPSPLSPVNGTTLTLPITLTWTDVPNPQPSGYELMIAKDSGFKTVEEDDPQQTDPNRTVLSLTPGTKFWRVRSAQGDNSPTTAAETAWSATGTFSISSAPPGPVSITIVNSQMYSGDTTPVQLQLSAGVAAGGATIALTSSNTAAFPVPATISMPGNLAWTQFTVQAGQVTASTPVTLTATINAKSIGTQFNVLPPSLKSLSISPSTISGGAVPQLIAMLNGQAPAGGAVVGFSSDSPAASPPASATAAPGSGSVSLGLPTSPVTVNTPVNITATWQGVSVQAHLTLLPQQPPATITLSPSTTVGQSGGSFATVTIASPASTDLTLQVTVSNPTVATMVPTSVTIPAGSTTGGFNIFTTAVTTQTLVTISVSGGGVTKSAVLTVTPSAVTSPAVSSVTLTPSAVTGGSGSQGTVTLASVAPSGGAAVALNSSNTSAASVPASVTVTAGATSATFSVATGSVTTATPVTISASSGGATGTATLTVNPAAQAGTITVTASGRTGSNVTSSPAGINVPVGSTASASFTTGTKITLTVSNGRDAIWSGACSSSGSKAKTCSFTLTGNGSLTANVQ
jgi:hypothetical protein